MRSNPQLPLFVAGAAAAILTVGPVVVVAAPSLFHTRVQPVHPEVTPAIMQLSEQKCLKRSSSVGTMYEQTGHRHEK